MHHLVNVIKGQLDIFTRLDVQDLRVVLQARLYANRDFFGLCVRQAEK
jgi:hypothetical protein